MDKWTAVVEKRRKELNDKLKAGYGRKHKVGWKRSKK